jgi:hypothetical protein
MSKPNDTLTELRTASAQLLLVDIADIDYSTVTDIQLSHLLGRAEVVIGNLVETIEGVRP